MTCDEETSAEQGMQRLLAHHPRLRTAEYALNTDAGGVTRTAAGRHVVSTQAAEKVYATFTLTATNPGGHSSVPRADNAIYALTAALQRLAAYRFPIGYNEVTRESFARRAPLESGALAAAGRGEMSGGVALPRARLLGPAGAVAHQPVAPRRMLSAPPRAPGPARRQSCRR